MAKETAKETAKNSAKTEKKVIGRPFKKGQSGNPNGRPKGKRNWQTNYNEALKDVAEDVYKKMCQQAEKEGLPMPEPLTQEDVEQIIERRAIKEAIDGNFSFYRETRDRQFGKATQPLKHEIDEGLKEALEKINTIIPD